MQACLLVLVLAASCASAPPATPPRAAEPAAADREVAVALNDQGKAAMYAGDAPSAVRLFRAAVARDPRAQYLFNLCLAQYQTGQFGDALASCRGARVTAEPAQLDKIDRLVQRIRDEAARQSVAL